MIRTLNVLRWGNGYGVRLPRLLLSEFQAKDGDVLSVEVIEPGMLVLRITDLKDCESAVKGTAGKAAREEPPLLDFDAVQRSLQSIVDQAGHLSEVMERKAAARGWVSRRALSRDRGAGRP
jgi:antitoxin component of MazEF toxin-antitoxin module